MSVSVPFRRAGRPLLRSILVLCTVAATSPALAADATVGSGGACTSAEFFTALDAVQNSGGGTVRFDCASPLLVTFDFRRSISADVTVEGGAFGAVVFTNTPGASLFQVFAQGSLTLRDVQMVDIDGNMTQYAIENFGALRLERVLVAGNTPSRSLIGNHGTLHVDDALFTANLWAGGSPQPHGVVLYNDGGSATIERVRFSENGGDAGTLGGAIFVDAGDVTVRDVDFDDNRAFDGGAVFVDNAGEFVAIDSRFSGNTASYGGAIEIQTGSVRLTQVRLTQNVAVTDGGAVWLRNLGSLTVRASRFDGNNAGQHGGAISNLDPGTVDIAWSAFDGNEAGGHGGAIHSAGNLLLRASTLVDNGAEDGGGGVYQTGTDVGAALDFVTVVGNRAGYGAGITNESGSGAGSGIAIGRSIVAANRIGPTDSGNCAGDSLSSNGYNLSDDTYCGGVFNTATDTLNASLPFEAFGAHGGPTPTLPPTAASDAIGAVALGCDTVDQRGASRAPAPCDAGAYERGGEPAPFDSLFRDGFETP